MKSSLAQLFSGLLLLSLPGSLISQTLHIDDAGEFIKDLLWKTPSLASWFDEGNLAMAHRLGIEYEGTPNKQLIAYDVDAKVIGMVQAGETRYTVGIDSLDREYSRVSLTLDGIDGVKEFYFRGKHCVSPLEYLTRNWRTLEGRYFRFYLSDSTLFNSYSREHLEFFVEQIAALIGLSGAEMQTLGEKKIYYYLCKDEDEIERMTGFRVKGMANLAYDAIVTTYNAHYHELLHLLLNYKLRRLPLYTHPFLQEGFAVANGGRGGLEAEVVLPLGRFLYQTRVVELSSLLENTGFRDLDPSLTYPASGIYCKYLTREVGMERFLRLYREHSGPFGDPQTLHISVSELPDTSGWVSYFRDSSASSSIAFDTAGVDARIMIGDSSWQIAEDSERYYFRISDVAVLPGSKVNPSYSSKAFRDALPEKVYKGEEYLVRVTEDDISVYNLFTNNLIATYAASFAIPPRKVPRVGGKYCFSVKRSVFDDPISPSGTLPDHSK
jgi:hypothetical protein